VWGAVSDEAETIGLAVAGPAGVATGPAGTASGGAAGSPGVVGWLFVMAAAASSRISHAGIDERVEDIGQQLSEQGEH
jgi:hypothetical protein